MINKGLICSIILGILLITITLLQIKIDNFLFVMQEKIEKVDSYLTIYSDDLDNENIISAYDDLKAYWDKNISTICLIIDYTKISPIGESISRLSAGIETKEYQNCSTETKQLLQMVGALKKIFGVRLPNIL